ncbi:MAG TPA: ubiquinol oxidase subunit II [Candidatus Paceibacterota bacterium]|nr:ubiquinol oxidase subunit II [Candidatus Paceibacterota bacterium]
MNKKYQLILLILVFLAVAGAVTWYLVAQNAAALPVLHPVGTIGEQERWLMIITVLLSAVVVIPVYFLLFIFAWKYRDTNPNAKHTYLPEWKHSRAAEIAWWLVPAIIIFIIAIITWRSSHTLDPYRPIHSSVPDMNIQVVALDWKWLFIYPDLGIASVNQLEFPEKTPLHFHLTADAPMNSFWIPRLGGQIYAMPGMDTQLFLIASSTGSFHGLSANISGNGFAGMNFTAKSDTPEEFSSWVEAVRQSPNHLTLSAYQDLAKPSEYQPVQYFSAVANGLFQDIVMKYMMPGVEKMFEASGTPSMSGMQMTGISSASASSTSRKTASSSGVSSSSAPGSVLETETSVQTGSSSSTTAQTVKPKMKPMNAGMPGMPMNMNE